MLIQNYNPPAGGQNSRMQGFTILELAIVIIIITTLSTLMFVSFNTARQSNRDTRRVADIHDMQAALAIYYRDWEKYPAANEVTAGMLFASGTITYMSPWPSNPNPRTDGTCPNDGYIYTPVSIYGNNAGSYSIRFCLGAANSDIGAGTSFAIPNQVITCVPNCVMSCGALSDGCGGTCAISNSCATGYSCVNDHCVKN